MDGAHPKFFIWCQDRALRRDYAVEPEYRLDLVGTSANRSLLGGTTLIGDEITHDWVTNYRLLGPIIGSGHHTLNCRQFSIVSSCSGWWIMRIFTDDSNFMQLPVFSCKPVSAMQMFGVCFCRPDAFHSDDSGAINNSRKRTHRPAAAAQADDLSPAFAHSFTLIWWAFGQLELTNVRMRWNERKGKGQS